MIIVREREDGKWRSLGRSDVEDVAEEVSLRGRLEGVFSWVAKRLRPGGYIVIEIEDKATIRVRRFGETLAMTGSIRPSSASLFCDFNHDATTRKFSSASDGRKSKVELPESIGAYFEWALGRLSDQNPLASLSGRSIAFKARKARRLEFGVLEPA